jgi:hypothetical protein
VRDTGENWSAYSSDILVCSNVDAGLVDYVKEPIEVETLLTCISDFIQLFLTLSPMTTLLVA